MPKTAMKGNRMAPVMLLYILCLVSLWVPTSCFSMLLPRSAVPNLSSKSSAFSRRVHSIPSREMPSRRSQVVKSYAGDASDGVPDDVDEDVLVPPSDELELGDVIADEYWRNEDATAVPFYKEVSVKRARAMNDAFLTAMQEVLKLDVRIFLGTGKVVLLADDSDPTRESEQPVEGASAAKDDVDDASTVGLTDAETGGDESDAEIDISWPPEPHSLETRLPFKQLEEIFDEHMKDESIPLFKDFKTYVDSLPTRQDKSIKLKDESGKYRATHLHLCKLPYYAIDDSVGQMVKQLEQYKLGDSRSLVKYICSPSGSGKSASVLIAFLKSFHSRSENRFTHYLHLAFDNNGGNYFRAKKTERISTEDKEAMDQGAQFMYDCVCELLESPTCVLDDVDGLMGGVRFSQGDKSYKIDVKEASVTPSELASVLAKKFPNSRILVHVDEHKKMSSNADFRRGAMQVLSEIQNVEVIASFIDPLGDIGAVGNSSSVCRYGVTLPVLDVISVMGRDERLRLPFEPSSLSTVEKRLLVSYLFLLSMSITYNGLSMLHVKVGVFNEMADGISAIITNNKNDNKKLLMECIRLCKSKISLSIDDEGSPYALSLLIAQTLERNLKQSFIDASVAELVIIGERVTSSLRWLLTTGDEKYTIYEEGRDHFRNILLPDTPDTNDLSDLMTSTPLEAAYVWTLSCLSARRKRLNFKGGRYEFKCKGIKAGRIFKNQKVDSFDASNLEEGIMYYPNESKGNPSHPRGDIFFLTDEDELVIIDVTGGGPKGAKQKHTNLADLIRDKDGKCGYKLRGGVLAPWIDDKAVLDLEERNEDVNVVVGDEARTLLGGLLQVRTWFEYIEKDLDEDDTV